MQILGFRDWYKQKETSKPSFTNGTDAAATKIYEKVYQIRKKVLTIHHTEGDLNEWKYDHQVERILITDKNLSEDSINAVKEHLTNGPFKGKKCFIAAYDFSSNDSSKCFKQSRKAGDSLRESLDIEGLESRGFGNTDHVSENLQKLLGNECKNTRIEIWALNFELNDSIMESEVPFMFNTNDYTLLENFKSTLRGMITKLILLESKRDITIGCMRTAHLNQELNESDMDNENLKYVSLLEYKNPTKSSYLDVTNKPKPSGKKMTIKELTEKRAQSVCDYLNGFTGTLKFKFIPEGLGSLPGKSRMFVR
jgi:hypothetical protein